MPRKIFFAVLISLIAVTTSACGPKPVFTTRHNMTVYSMRDMAAQTDIEHATEIVADLLVQARPGLYSRSHVLSIIRRHNIHVLVTPERLNCGQPHGKPQTCAGLSTATQIAYWHRPCIGQTALAHELLHVLRGFVEGDVDAEHRDFAMFGWGLSLEAMAYLALACSDAPRSTPAMPLAKRM